MPKTVVMVSLVFGQDVHQVLIATGGHMWCCTETHSGCPPIQGTSPARNELSQYFFNDQFELLVATATK